MSMSIAKKTSVSNVCLERKSSMLSSFVVDYLPKRHLYYVCLEKKLSISSIFELDQSRFERKTFMSSCGIEEFIAFYSAFVSSDELLHVRTFTFEGIPP